VPDPLTLEHRAAQIRIRAAVARRVITLGVSDQTSPRFVGWSRSITDTVNTGRGLSARAAIDYYGRLRSASGVSGPYAKYLPANETLGTLGRRLGIVTRLAANDETRLVLVQGVTGRSVLQAGRDALIGTGRTDPRSGRWARVTGGEACDFCLMLAGRGAVYYEDSADFAAHDHCACMVEPQFS